MPVFYTEYEFINFAVNKNETLDEYGIDDGFYHYQGIYGADERVAFLNEQKNLRLILTDVYYYESAGFLGGPVTYADLYKLDTDTFTELVTPFNSRISATDVALSYTCCPDILNQRTLFYVPAGFGYYSSYLPNPVFAEYDWDSEIFSRLTTIGLPDVTSVWMNRVPQMAWDNSKNVAYLYGSDPTLVNPYLIYEYNPTTNTWTDKSVYGTEGIDYPEYRDIAGFSYDYNLQKVILTHGGIAGDVKKDTWSFDGTEWVSLTPFGAPGVDYPEARTYFGFTIASNGKNYLVSGTDGSTTYRDVWRWDSSNLSAPWEKILTTNSLSPFTGLVGRYPSG